MRGKGAIRVIPVVQCTTCEHHAGGGCSDARWYLLGVAEAPGSRGVGGWGGGGGDGGEVAG